MAINGPTKGIKFIAVKTIPNKKNRDEDQPNKSGRCCWTNLQSALFIGIRMLAIDIIMPGHWNAAEMRVLETTGVLMVWGGHRSYTWIILGIIFGAIYAATYNSLP